MSRARRGGPATPGDPSGSSATSHALLPVVDRLVEQRHVAAAADVARLREEHPTDSADDLADRLIRRYAKDLAMTGAVTGGAAASPVAGMAVAAASAGADAAFNVSRLGEMIMGLGIIYGHEALSIEERRTAVLAVMGIADGAAVGMTGLAARAGARGGARVLQRLPAAGTTVAKGAGVGRKAMAKMANTKGPWSLTSLIPYGIGAGVGAAGNALLARAVGRAAKEYFSGSPTAGDREIVVEVIDSETELLDPEPGADSASARWQDHHPPPPFHGAASGSWVVEDEILDAEIVD